MSPEQIAQIRGYEIAGEKARQQPIESMIQAYLGIGADERQAQHLALQAAQERRINAMLPLQQQMEQSKLETAKIQRDTALAALAQHQATGPLELQKLQEEITGRRATTAGELARAELTRLQTQLAQETKPLERQRIQAQIEHLTAQTGEIGAAREQRKTEFAQTHVDMTFPDGSVAKVPAAQVMQEISKGAVVSDKEFERQRAQAHDVRQAAADAEKRQSDADAAEATLLGTDARGNPNYKNPAADVFLNTHNIQSGKDYFYRQSSAGSKPERVYLKDAAGTPLPARSVYKGWVDFRKKHPDQSTISLFDYADLLRKGMQ